MCIATLVELYFAPTCILIVYANLSATNLKVENQVVYRI